MPEASEKTEYFLLPLDAGYGLRMVVRDIEARTQRDEHVREARSKLEERFRSLPSEQDRDEILAPVLWASARESLADERAVVGIRKWLEDGETVLRAVDEGLADRFSVEALDAVTTEARARAEADSTFAARLDESRRELESVRDLPDSDVVAHALLAMLILICILCLIILYLLS